MSANANVYDSARYAMASAGVNLATATITAALCTNLYVPDFTAHHALSDISNEVVGSGYVRQTLLNTTLTNRIGRTVFSSDPVVFQAIGSPMTARWMVLFIDTGVPLSSTLLGAVLLDNTPADAIIPAGKSLVATPDPANGWLYV